MLALLEAYRAGLLKPPYWMPNIVAGLIVGVVALHLAMAFAIASGAKPEQGLYTAIIAAFLVGIFGGSRVQIAGPTGAFIVGFASGIGCVIFVGQWKDFFGLPFQGSLDMPFHLKLWGLLHTFSHANSATLFLGCLSLFLIFITPKLFKRLPGPLVAMVV